MANEKSTKIQAEAVVVDIGSWLPLRGPQFYLPLVTFRINGDEMTWPASSDHLTKKLAKGDTVKLVGYTKDNATISRVSYTIL